MARDQRAAALKAWATRRAGRGGGKRVFGLATLGRGANREAKRMFGRVGVTGIKDLNWGAGGVMIANARQRLERRGLKASVAVKRAAKRGYAR